MKKKLFFGSILAILAIVVVPVVVAQLAPVEPRLERLAASLRETSFDLAKAPLLKMTLIRLSEASYHFIWSFTRLLLDDKSSRQIFDEAFAVYEGLVRDQQRHQPALPPLRRGGSWPA